MKSRRIYYSISITKTSKKRSWLFLGLIVLFVSSFSFTQAACIITKESPAPGCIERIGLPLFGGCFGKSVILDLQVGPRREDVIFRVNNCNGGVLEVRNASDQLLVLGGVEIKASGHATLDVKERQPDGFFALKEIGSNFSAYIPAQNEVIKVRGLLGKEQVTLIYIKTKKLCD